MNNNGQSGRVVTFANNNNCFQQHQHAYQREIAENSNATASSSHDETSHNNTSSQVQTITSSDVFGGSSFSDGYTHRHGGTTRAFVRGGQDLGVAGSNNYPRGGVKHDAFGRDDGGFTNDKRGPRVSILAFLTFFSHFDFPPVRSLLIRTYRRECRVQSKPDYGYGSDDNKGT